MDLSGWVVGQAYGVLNVLFQQNFSGKDALILFTISLRNALPSSVKSRFYIFPSI